MLTRAVGRCSGVVVVSVCVVLATLISAGCGSSAPEVETTVVPGEAHSGSPPVRPPNILIIIADDVGVDQIGVYAESDRPARTPNIDALAARGLLFRNTWSNPVCSSTRATILTGRYGFRTGVGFVAGPSEELEDREHTLPEALSRHATVRYGTAAFGKWHLSAGQTWEADGDILVAPYRAGFSFYRGVFTNIAHSYENWRDITVVARDANTVLVEGGTLNTEYNTSEVVSHAGAWIRDFEARRPDDPWFVWLAFNAAHSPYHKPPQHLHSADLSDPLLTCSNPHPYTRPENLVPCYQAMIEAMDTEIGRLLNKEISVGSLDRTSVIFVGDNGSVNGTQARGVAPDRAKGTPYEGGVNVPLIIAGAGIESSMDGQARESQALVNTTDLFATVLEMAGLDVAASVPSRYALIPARAKIDSNAHAHRGSEVVLDSYSLMPHIRSPSSYSAEHAREFVYTELFRQGPPDDQWPPASAIRNQRGFKLIRFLDEATGARREELYDLESDPAEQSNLLGSLMTEASSQALIALYQRLEAIEQTGWRPHGSDPN